ncbi:TetR/AcrR family transcriptional regulator [Propionibacteriaceae bacterium G1746]|uniref:TetR/AcrR family transcriptional regulator n=1 Tax=Aestuariimicrobium sp. G57 TaxID=3418485 RepID=UPI003C20AC54
MGSVTDLTARAQIRDAAAALFAEHGFDRVTMRQVAASAGVSPALVVHHFGSKDGLRTAVVDHVVAWFDNTIDKSQEALDGRNWQEVLNDAADSFTHADTLPRLFGRMLVDRDPAMQGLFARIVERSEIIMQRYIEAGVMSDDPDSRLRTAMLVASDLGALMFRPYLSSFLGFDPYGDGMPRWAAVATRVYASLLVDQSFLTAFDTSRTDTTTNSPQEQL